MVIIIIHHTRSMNLSLITTKEVLLNTLLKMNPVITDVLMAMRTHWSKKMHPRVIDKMKLHQKLAFLVSDF